MCYMFVFFFKQKTAYELRISDWSSDVCSSDLDRNRHLVSHASVLNRARPGPKVFAQAKPGFLKPLPPVCDDRHGAFGQTGVARGKSAPDVPRRWIAARQPVHVGERSEEHTSELQSLMRISYAVFCLKKKKK